MGLNRARAAPRLPHRSPHAWGSRASPSPSPNTPSTAPLHLQLHRSPAATAPQHPHTLLLEKAQPREKYPTLQVKILKSSSQAGSPDGFLCILKAQPAPVPGMELTLLLFIGL